MLSPAKRIQPKPRTDSLSPFLGLTLYFISISSHMEFRLHHILNRDVRVLIAPAPLGNIGVADCPVRTPHDASHALLAVPGSMTEEEQAVIREVREIFKTSYKVHCTGCRYCMPCPAGVDIPACFTAYNTRYSISKSQGMIQYYMGNLMSDAPSYAGLCKKCGKCEAHCPQNLQIREDLKAVAKTYEGPLFQVAKLILPLFVRKKKT